MVYLPTQDKILFHKIDQFTVQLKRTAQLCLGFVVPHSFFLLPENKYQGWLHRKPVELTELAENCFKHISFQG